jgi:hypothetical protein
MKTNWLNWKNNLVLVLLTSLSLASNAQSISEKLGGVATSFTIKSDTTLLNQERQIILQRGVAHSYADYESSLEGYTYGYGYGYGYQSYHIEFVSTEKIQELENRKRRKNSSYTYYLIFINKDSNRVHTQTIYEKDVKMIAGESGKETVYAYSINLADIPLILLDSVTEINIVKY